MSDIVRELARSTSDRARLKAHAKTPGTDKHVVRVTGDPKRERPRRVGARPRSAVASAAPGRLAKNYGAAKRPKFVEDATSRVAQLQDIPPELFAYSSPFRQELGRGKVQDVRQFGFISDLS